MTARHRPLFSAVIPVFNGEKYLGATLDCVLALDYAPMEVVVIDDGSHDSTAEIIGKYGSRIRSLHQTNRGPAAARNLGLQFAQGEILGFLDADDLWTAQIAEALELLSAHPEIAVVQGRVQEIVDRPGTTGQSYQKHSEPYPFINIGSALYRKEVFTAVGGFDESMRFCEDYDWFLRAFDARVTKLRIDDVTLLYRTHADGMTFGKTVHEMSMARAHKKAIQRRRAGFPGPSGSKAFPTLAEYIGSRPAPRRDVLESPLQSDLPHAAAEPPSHER